MHAYINKCTYAHTHSGHRQGAGTKTFPAPQQHTSPCPTPTDDWDIDVARSNVLFLQTKCMYDLTIGPLKKCH